MPIDPKQFDDEQLDALLRDVSVPSDLKDSLRQIPPKHGIAGVTTDQKVERKTHKSQNGRPATWMMVLAASLAAVAAFAGWQWYAGQNGNDAGMVAKIGQADSNDDAETIPNIVDDDAESKLLAELDQEIATLTTMLDQIEIQKMKQLLSQTETSRYETELANQDVQSLIIALSDQISLPLGGNSDSVESDMAQVIDKFPGSMGAEIAREYLSQINN